MTQHSTSPPQPGPDPRPTLYTRLLALVVRPTAPTVSVGIVVAAAFIVGETLLVKRLEQVAPENDFGCCSLSACWSFRRGGDSVSRSPRHWRVRWSTSSSTWRPMRA